MKVVNSFNVPFFLSLIELSVNKTIVFFRSQNTKFRNTPCTEKLTSNSAILTSLFRLELSLHINTELTGPGRVNSTPRGTKHKPIKPFKLFVFFSSQGSTSGIGSDFPSSNGSMQSFTRRFGLFSSKRVHKNPSERKLTKSAGSLEDIKSMRRKTSSTSDQRKSEFFVTSPIATWPTCDLILAWSKDHVTLIVSTRCVSMRCVMSLEACRKVYLVPRALCLARLERAAARFSKSSGNEFCENRSRLYTVKYQIFRKTCIYKILDQSLHKRNIVTKTKSGSPSENHLGAQNIKMFTSIYRENIWLKLTKVALYHWEKFWMFWSKPGSVSGKIRRLIWNTRGHFKNWVELSFSVSKLPKLVKKSFTCK